MTTVIDELVVVLGLDPKQFNQAQKDAVAQFKKTQEELRKQGTETERVAKKNAESFSAARGQVLGFLGAFLGLGALKQFTVNLTTADAAIGRTSIVIQTSVKDIAAWQSAIVRAGGTTEGATASLSGLVQEFQQFSITGQSAVIPYFRALGVNISDLVTGKMRPLNDILLDVAQKFQEMNDPAKAATFGRALGFDQGTINLLIQGRTAVSALLDKSKELGQVTKEDSENAQRLAAAWHDLDQAATALGRDIANYLTPALTGFLKAAAASLSWWRTPKGQAEAKAQGEAQGEELRRRFGTPRAGLSAAAARLLGAQEAGAEGGAGAGGKGDAALRMKPGANAGGSASLGTLSLARALQNDVPGLQQFTALNDQYHAGTTSKHAQGLAIDFTIHNAADSPQVAEAVRSKLAAAGIDAKVLDEYVSPSKGSTGGHIHVQFQNAAAAQRYADLSSGRAGVSNVDSSRSSTSTSTSDTKIGSINVYAPTGDARDIARTLEGSVSAGALSTQANSGPGG